MKIDKDKTESSAKSRTLRKKILFSRGEFILQHLDPRQWSLKARFLYLSGALLLLGNAVLIIFFYFTQHSNVQQVASDRLSMLAFWLESELEQQQKFHSAQAMALATIPEINESLATGDPQQLGRVALPFLDRLRSSTGIVSFDFHFLLDDGSPLFLTGLEDIRGQADRKDDVPTADRPHARYQVHGIVTGQYSLDIQATAPVIHKQLQVGELIVSSSVSDTLRNLRLPRELGIVVLLRDLADKDHQLKVISRFGDKALGLEQAVRVTRDRPARVGNLYTSFMSLKDEDGQTLGGLLLSYDAALQRQIMWSKISQFILFFSAGAIMLWVFLYINVIRIEKFLSRLKKILISSHSNYFTERFESDHVHCLDILHCHNEECPVYQSPSLVCYLETGTDAVSPRWRDTCIYLNKYEKCENCPVYSMRKGDEVTEMRNVVNTMMKLWGNFLNRVGHLLSYVLLNQERTGQVPSLDEVSERLEQMARLTFFSHDLQGVIDKEEVFEQLSHIFMQRFNLSRFVLFEVDYDNQRTLIALDTVQDEPFCKNTVLINPDACRAKRVAEEVTSYYNPKLCLHFNANLDKDVRCCLPIVMGGQVGAVFSFLTSKRDWGKIRTQIPLIRKYLEESAPVLNSLKLLGITREQSLRDPLTLCNNRRFLDEFIVKYEPLAEREGKHTGFLMVDMDYFKQVNDKYGHQAGDAVLQQLAQILRGSIRKSDLLIRYGGEEFLILLQNIQNGHSKQIAEKIRSAVE